MIPVIVSTLSGRTTELAASTGENNTALPFEVKSKEAIVRAEQTLPVWTASDGNPTDIRPIVVA